MSHNNFRINSYGIDHPCHPRTKRCGLICSGETISLLMSWELYVIVIWQIGEPFSVSVFLLIGCREHLWLLINMDKAGPGADKSSSSHMNLCDSVSGKVIWFVSSLTNWQAVMMLLLADAQHLWKDRQSHLLYVRVYVCVCLHSPQCIQMV